MKMEENNSKFLLKRVGKIIDFLESVKNERDKKEK